MNTNIYITTENEQKKFSMITDKTYVIPADCKYKNISDTNTSLLLNYQNFQNNITTSKNTKKNNCLICLIPFCNFHKYAQMTPKKYTCNFKICPKYSNLIIIANGKHKRKKQKSKDNEYLKEIVKNKKNKKLKRYNSVLDKFKIIKEEKTKSSNSTLNGNYLDNKIIKFSKPIINDCKIHKKKYSNSSYDDSISKKKLLNKRNTVVQNPKNLELEIIKQIDYKKLLDKKEMEFENQDDSDESEEKKSNSGDDLENELYCNKNFKNPSSISGMKNTKYKNNNYNKKYLLRCFSKINDDSIYGD